MKKILPFLFVASCFNAHAGYLCKLSELYEEHTVTIQYDGLYTVGSYGTRNLFLADYASSNTYPFHDGYLSFVTKIADRSTWKNMPQKLEIEEIKGPNGYFYPVSIKGLEKRIINFSPENCHEIPNRPGPKVCHPRREECVDFE